MSVPPQSGDIAPSPPPRTTNPFTTIREDADILKVTRSVPGVLELIAGTTTANLEELMHTAGQLKLEYRPEVWLIWHMR